MPDVLKFHRNRDVVTFNGEPVKVTCTNASSFGLTFAPFVRRFPRITLERKDGLWFAKWQAQNDSYFAVTGKTRLEALRHLLGTWRIQRWPLFGRL